MDDRMNVSSVSIDAESLGCLRACRPQITALPARVGRYVVGPTLGRGSFGVVVRTFHEGLGIALALKLIERDLIEVEEIEPEAHALGRVDHPNVVRIYDAGTIEEPGPWRGQRYLVMECIEGGSLDRWLLRRPRGWQTVLAVFLDAGRGLAAIHAQGLVHRDFKPANVLVSDDVPSAVKIVDLGLAVRSGSAGGSAGRQVAPAGTPRFLAPECWVGVPASAASDQFSFCVALYMALFGQHPFCAETSACRTRRPRPHGMVPGRVAAAIDRGLALEPGERFADMDALLAALTVASAAPRRWGGALRGLFTDRASTTRGP